MSIEAMKLALEALENHTAIKHPQQRHYRDSAIDALRVAIEQAEKQEPVGWVECDGVVVWYNRDAAIGRDLYTAPRQWQGLTDEEIQTAWASMNHDPAAFVHFAGGALWAEARMKEKNHG